MFESGLMTEEKYECGPGRNAKQIADILAEWLPPILEKYKIQEIIDLGCGDLYWFAQIPFKGIYRGYDEVIRKSALKRLESLNRESWSLHQADVMVDYFGSCDMAIVKDVFIHYGSMEIMELLRRLQDKATYLLAESHSRHSWPRATTHRKTEDGRIYDCAGNSTNITKLVGEPLEQVEILSEAKGRSHGRKIVGLWNIREAKF